MIEIRRKKLVAGGHLVGLQDVHTCIIFMPKSVFLFLQAITWFVVFLYIISNFPIYP